MLTVIINWALIAITSYAIGFAASKLLLKIAGVSSKSFPETCPHVATVRVFLGLALITAYAEVWSLFSGVGAAALIVVVAVSIVLIIFSGKEMYTDLSLRPGFNLIIAAAVILLMAYGTSRGYMHYDTNLYHAQAIRWIEQYGVVPGLANLQSRFGYNSAEFALNALYSMAWYNGRSLHCTAGFFALMSVAVLSGIKNIYAGKDADGKHRLCIRVSDYVRLGLLFYLGMIFAEMISPASDYYAQLLIFNIIILWLDITDIKTESQEKDTEYIYKSILCILLVYAITIKLSIGLLVLLALIPGIYWIKRKNVKSIFACITGGLVISLPYFIRNHIISGWILYPSTFIGIGRPDWQLRKGEAMYDAREISMWGRGITSADMWKDVTATNWIKDWFCNLALLEKAWVAGTLFASIGVVVLLVISIVRYIRKKDTRTIDEKLLVSLIILVGVIFWFCSAPLVRYGYAYLIIMPLYFIGYISEKATAEKSVRIANCVFVMMAVLIVGLKLKGLAADIIRTYAMDNYVTQQDYIDGEAYTYELDGVTIYVAEDAGQIGYYKFPASPDVKDDICLRGIDIEEGFRKK